MASRKPPNTTERIFSVKRGGYSPMLLRKKGKEYVKGPGGGNQKTLIRRRRQKKDFHSKNFNFSPFWSIFGKQFRRFSFMRGLFCPNNFSREYRGGNPLNDIKSASDILRQKYAHGRMAEIPNCKKPPMAFTKKFRLRQKLSAQTYAISSHF